VRSNRLRRWPDVDLGPFEVTGTLAVEFVEERQTYRVTRTQDSRLTYRGLALVQTLGFDYRASPAIAVGPAFELAEVFPISACYDGPLVTPVAPTPICSHDANPVVTANRFVAWSVALGVNVLL
jgi:hypothetical protein